MEQMEADPVELPPLDQITDWSKINPADLLKREKLIDGVLFSKSNEKSIYDRKRELLETSRFSDVKFFVGEWPADKGQVDKTKLKVFAAHKLILFHSSAVFKAMFAGGLAEGNEVVVPDMEPDIFARMLKYIYLNVLEVEDNDLLPMLYAAEKYGLEELRKEIAGRLVKILDNECVFGIYEQTHHLNCAEIQKGILDYVREKTALLLKSKFFENYSSDAIGLLLDQPALAVSEINLLDCCIQWARRQPSFGELKGDERDKLRTVLGDHLFKFRFRSLLPEQISFAPPFMKLFTEQEINELKKFVKQGRDKESSAIVSKLDVFPRFSMCTYFDFGKQSFETQMKFTPEISDVFSLQTSVKIELVGFQLKNSSVKIHPIVTLDVISVGPGKQSKKHSNDPALMIRKDSLGMTHCYLKNPITMHPKVKLTFTFKFKLQNGEIGSLKGLSSTQYSKSCPKGANSPTFGVWRENHCDQLHVNGIFFRD